MVDQIGFRLRAYWYSGSDCFLKYFFVRKCIEIIIFFIFKNLFLTSAYQNYLKKIPKIINLKQEKIKNNLF